MHLGIPSERLPSPASLKGQLETQEPLAVLLELAQGLGVVVPDLGDTDFARLWSVYRRNVKAVGSRRRATRAGLCCSRPKSGWRTWLRIRHGDGVS
ncbi:MAG: hypothetical protein GY856_26410 [bacterium]|nr:hypothetical protein [bacterium]